MKEGPPAIESLIPHRDPMRLLRVVVEAEPERLAGVAVIPGDNPLVADGSAPCFLGLEAAAQAAATLEAIHRRCSAPGPRLGYLVGVRDAAFHRARIPADLPFNVTVEARGSAPPLAIYEARVEMDGEPILLATISTYVVP